MINMGSDEYEDRIAEELREIFDEHLDAMRRAGVAERKREGYKIESTEALRLFREATGYLTRLRELREDLNAELDNSSYYHVERVIGHLEDYNRILDDLKRNPSFENAVSSFDPISYNYNEDATKDMTEDHTIINDITKGYNVVIEGRTGFVKFAYEKRTMGAGTSVQKNVPMDGTTTVETFVYPRLTRLTKDMEHSVIGRCASGKRPD
jgi:uncharacterized protein YozE (UPF0346 family)